MVFIFIVSMPKLQQLHAIIQLYEPYTDNPETRGVMRIEPEVLNDFVPKFVRDGWQVVSDPYRHCLRIAMDAEEVQNIHAIGDRANAIVIDTLQSAIADAGTSGHEVRPRIEHAQIILPEDAMRLARIGGKLRTRANASMQALTRDFSHCECSANSCVS